MSFYFVYEVGRIACLVYSVVSLHHPVYQKQARGAHMSKSLSFLTSGGVCWGVSYGETKTCPGPCFVNIDVEDFGGWNFDVLGGLPGFPEVGNLKVF